MSTLILHLPLARNGAATEYHYTLSVDGQQVTRHGAAVASMLPQASRAGETVALVPVQALSWQRVLLPPGVGPQSPRLRSVLEGLLEDRLLDEPAALHFALEPQARAGHSAWVAVCDRHWLNESLQALESAGHAVARVVPEFSPASPPAVQVLGSSPEDAWCAHALGPGHGVALLPLASAQLNQSLAGMEGGEAPPPLWSEPAVAALAEQALGQRVQLQTEHSRALLAAQGPWDLAQADLARSPRARALRQLASLAGNLLRAPQWQAARWGAALCVLVQLAGINAWAWSERKALADKQAQIKNLLLQTFPQVKVAAMPLVQMEREVALLRQSAGSLSPRDFETLLAAAGAGLPGPALPSGLDYSPGQLRLRGVTLSGDALAAANAPLRGTGHRLQSDADSLTVQAISTAP